MKFPKNKKWRSKRYREWIKQQPCIITGKIPSQCHHWRGKTGGGTAIKPSDHFCLPLSFDYHLGQHGIHHFGVDTWLDIVDLTECDIWRKFGELWGKYSIEHGII